MKTTTEKIFTTPIYVVLLAVLCTILWGSAYPSVKIGYKLFALSEGDISGKLIFAGIRFFAAGLITIVILWILNKKLILPKRSDLKAIVLVGSIQTVLEYICFYIGLSNTTGVKGSILNASVSFFAVILAHIFYKNDKINLQKAMGCIIGFLGIIIINMGTIGDNLWSFNFMGDGLVILAAFSFAVGTLIGKIVSKDINPMALTGYQLVFGGIVLMTIGFITGGKLNQVNIPGTFLLTYMAFLSAAAFTVWTILLKYNKMSTISIYNFLTPVFGTILSAVFLGEEIFKIKNILALILVCSGIYIINGKQKI
jgi:drug/metabolite transporter (DMT)-like permease